MMNFVAGRSDDGRLLDQQGFRRQMLLECEAMARYALASGMKVAPETIQSLDALMALSQTQSQRPAGDTPPPEAAPQTAAPAAQAGPSSDGDASLKLAQLHASLAEAVHPAQPGTILLIEMEKREHQFWSGIGPLPIVRRLLLISIVCLLLLCGVSTSNVINDSNMSKSWFELSGYDALWVELFLVSTAGLGACFSNLSRVKVFIDSGTYDPKSDSDYWIRLVIGMMAGIILSQILFEMISNPVPAEAGTPSSKSLPGLTRMIVAFLGGYAAAQVQSLLDNLSASIGALFGGAASLPRPAPAQKGTAGGGGGTVSMTGTTGVTTPSAAPAGNASASAAVPSATAASAKS